MSRVDAIVIHHAAAPRDTTVEEIRSWHRAKGWRDIGYHWLITQPPGRPAVLRFGRQHNLDDDWEPWEHGAHAQGHNGHTIGVCLVGDFTHAPPPPEMLDQLHGWLVTLCLQFGLEADAIRGHGEMEGAATACPGAMTDLDAIRSRVAAALNPND